MHKLFTRKKQLTLKKDNSPQKPLTFICQRLFLWLLIIPVTLLSACSSLTANAYYYPITPENVNTRFMNTHILSSFLIKSKKYNSLPIVEFSDLAWDEDEQLLYVISDEGYLYHLKLSLTENTLKSVEIVFATRLKDKQGKKLKGKFRDAEGLALRNANNGKQGDSKLIISFELKPRIVNYSPKGKFINKASLVRNLHKKRFYRHQNNALESVALHPKYGILTAAEKPLKRKPLTQQSVYSSDGKEWNFEASKTKNSSITAIEVLPNGDVLILERAYNGLLSPIIITLRQLHIGKCKKDKLCDTSLIAKFNSANDWKLDNFEGLTHFRDNQYFMVSDNNNNPLQKTILVLFEVIDQ